jgi:methylmalonyl-CoA/ethylmalonyl-CoA epimerase
MNPTHIEHIGIAVSNLENSVRLCEKIFGLNCYKIEEVADQKVRTAFFKVGGTKIELMESTDPEGPISKFIEKRGEGVHHIAFAVDNIEKQLEAAAKEGVRLIDTKPRKGAEDLDIAFFHPKSTMGILVELCERKNK